MKRCCRRDLRAFAALLILAGGGCAGGSGSRLSGVYAAYNSGQYNAAFHRAEALVGSANRKAAGEAAYMAGISAYRMNDWAAGARYLRMAAASRDKALAADASATLGLVYAQQGHHAQAGQAFARAAKAMSGENQANAYYYAAMSLQKTGQWSQARSYLMLARSATSNTALRERIAEALGTTGFTMQLGFYSVRPNAEREAQRVAQKAAEHSLGYPRVVPATDARGQPGFLVQIGQFSSYASAIAARDRFGEAMTLIVPLAR